MACHVSFPGNHIALCMSQFHPSQLWKEIMVQNRHGGKVVAHLCSIFHLIIPLFITTSKYFSTFCSFRRPAFISETFFQALGIYNLHQLIFKVLEQLFICQSACSLVSQQIASLVSVFVVLASIIIHLENIWSFGGLFGEVE